MKVSGLLGLSNWVERGRKSSAIFFLSLYKEVFLIALLYVIIGVLSHKGNGAVHASSLLERGLKCDYGKDLY